MARGHRVIRVKICGITRREDARAAVRAGAHALGFVFHPSSPRSVTPQKAASIISILPPFVVAVGVFVNLPKLEMEVVAAKSGIHAIQLHGDESPEDCRACGRPVIKAFRFGANLSLPQFAAYPKAGLLVDTAAPGKQGGTGVPLDWERLSAHLNSTPGSVRERLILAGGLNPDNVSRAVSLVRPFAVDVSSGVETSPGKKSEKLIEEFIHAVRNSTGPG